MEAQGLRIQLLGEFCITYDGARVAAASSPRLHALLAYLVLHRAAPQPRQHLAFLLWPDSAEEQARTNLRNLLHLLRHALPHPDCCVRCESQHLHWQPHIPYSLDVVEFETAVARGDLSTAVELYRGDLLPHVYDDWIEPERERLGLLYIASLEQLVRQAEDAQDYRAALRHAHQLVRRDPLCERYAAELIRLQVLLGDRVGALRSYQNLARALRREMGIEPAPALRRLHDDLLGRAIRAETAKRSVTAKSLSRIVAEALAAVTAVAPDEARHSIEVHPHTLLIDVRDAVDVAATGTLPGAANISLGALTCAAAPDAPEAWRDPRLVDRDRPIITTCGWGPLGALAGKLLREMGFTNVRILAGGVQAWRDAGFPVAPPGGEEPAKPRQPPMQAAGVPQPTKL